MNRSLTGFDNVSSTNVFKDALSTTGKKTMNFQEQEILEILAKMRAQSTSGEHQVIERVKALSQNGSIGQEQFVVILKQDGNMSQTDAAKVALFFSERGHISIIKFDEYLKQALHIQAINSPTLIKFIKLVQGQ